MKKKLNEFKAGEKFQHPIYGLCMAVEGQLPVFAVVLDGPTKGQMLHRNIMCPAAFIPEFEVI